MQPIDKPFSRRRSRRWPFRLVVTTGLLAGLFQGGDVQATPATFTFPAPNPGWVVARNGGMPIVDVEGDAGTARDIVGDATHPALFIASDATHLYFRLRLDVDPRQNATNIGPFGWGCLINTDNDRTTYEYSTIVDGVNSPDMIYFYKNSVTTTPNSPADAPDLPAITSVGAPLTVAVGHVQIVQITPGNFGNNGNIDDDWFMDWAIELAPALLAGFNPANPANYYCGSANNGTNIGTDCTGATGCGALDTTFTDSIACGPLGCSICGDGIVGAVEGCDDGNLTSGDGCNNVCLKELGQPCAGNNATCASGYCDPSGNICACDANADCPAGQLCSVTPNPNVCVAPGCGNSILEAGEGCDDGNTTIGDGCDAVCLKELLQNCVTNAVCASGFCDSDGNVCVCDADVDCPAMNVCNLQAMPNACVPTGCGNGVIEINEGCDDGNTLPGDGCNPFCYIEILQGCTNSDACASGFCDPMVNQCTCDSDEDCGGLQTCNTALSPSQCIPEGCGNGLLALNEGCDDGNLNNGDGCNAQCLKELGQMCSTSSVCASGFCDMLVCACNENVDCPGFQLCNVQANPNVCVDPGCGNFVMEGNEGCDDGNTTNGDGCTNGCLLELGETCTNSSACASNACDPATSMCVCDENADCPVGTPVCKLSVDPNICVIAGCGNGVVEMSEACDDDNTTSGDGCTNTCLLEIGQNCPNGSTSCESGFCDPAGTVCACDETTDCNGAQLCNVIASPNLCVDPGCGNGVVEMGEACDDDNTTGGDGCSAGCLLEIGQSCINGSSSCASGFCDSTDNTCACDQNADCSGGQVCDTNAMPNACVDPGCGNLVVEPNEGCDDGNKTPGDGCSNACLLELGQTCPGVSTFCESGFCDSAGSICACDQDSDCPNGGLCNTASNPNVCVPVGCGNGVLEMGEGCDDGNTAAGDGCSIACLIELGSACTTSSSCASGLCDVQVCACNQDSDCKSGELCNTTANPNTCVVAGCGNSVLEPNEGCDDGNTTPGDGCDIFCTKELGETCTDDTECGSSHCDDSSKQCVCDKDTDCFGGKICDTTANPHVCIVPPPNVCQSDTDCASGLFCDEPSGQCVACTKDDECKEGVCDETSFQCVGCLVDADCGAGTCAKDTQTCKPNGVSVEGSGIICSTSSTAPTNESWPFGLLGMLGLGALLRRRR